VSTTRALIRGLLAAEPDATRRLHAEHINPTFVEALDLLGFGRDFVRAEGLRLVDAEGVEVVDFLSGYGAGALGHNHPDVRAAVEEALAAPVPHFLLVSPQPLASALAQRLARLAPGDLSIVTLGSTGSEVVEAALKLARAATRRHRFVAAERGYHGTTLGALSIAGSRRSRKPFEPLLPGCVTVPFGDTAAIERELRRRDVAAVVLEPIQGEGGVRLPPPGYLADVAALCRRYGTLLVLDEVQTGLGRTGRLFACEHDGVEPDVLLLGKGLSGGVAPVAAMITRRDLHQRAYGALDRYDLHCSTFAGGPIACAAALATLDVIQRDGLCAHAAQLGHHLGERIISVAVGHPLVREVRGRGLFWGIELASPPGVAADLIGQWVVVGMLRRGVLTQVCGGAANVVRAQPPLGVDRAAIETFTSALQATLAEDAPGMIVSLARAATQVIRRRFA
jgi:putrescine aminotransferase